MLSTNKPDQRQSRLGDWLENHEDITMSQNAGCAESGIAEDLYSACFDGLRYIYRALNRESRLSTRESQSLREDIGKFLLWGDGFCHGKLDKALNTSDSLKTDVLAILQNIASLLIRSNRYGQSVVQLQELVEKVQEVTSASLEADDKLIDDDTGGEESSEMGDHDQDVSNPTKEHSEAKFCREISDNISCLLDFVFVLEQTLQSADSDFQRVRQSVLFQLSGPAHAYVANIREKYQLADLKLVQRSGEANWQRHMRIRSMVKPAEEATAISIEAKSIFTPFSTFHDSGLGRSLPAVSTYAASNASHTSFASSLTDDKESTSLRVPATPAKVGTGKPFECSICGEMQYNIRDRISWKIHVFSDLQPYICTFSTCKDELITFPSRKLWADHEFSMHRMTRIWVCPFCKEECSTIAAWKDHILQSHKTTFNGSLEQTAISSAERKSEQSIKEQCCPFCLEYPAIIRRNFVTHVGRHLEDIALATLPREEISDAESEDSMSEEEESSLDVMLMRDLRHRPSVRVESIVAKRRARVGVLIDEEKEG